MAKINFVWAEDLDGWIGKDNGVPWHVSADLHHFKEETMGHPVVMGRSTYDSIGRPLPKRLNIVLTHRDIADDRIQTFSSLLALQEWLDSSDEEVMVIGGARLFEQLLPLANVLTRTVINGRFNGDTKMPPIDYDQWQLVDRQPVKENGTLVCWFEKWVLHVK